MSNTLRPEAAELAEQLDCLARGRQASVFAMSWWSRRLLAWSMQRPAFRDQLFRFVDVYPATRSDRDAFDHLAEYLAGEATPALLRTGLRIAAVVPGGRAIVTAIARREITRMGRQFIIGRTAAEAADAARALWDSGIASTLDLLGEHTLSDHDADLYAARAEEMLAHLVASARTWTPRPRLERDDLGPIARAQLSVKPTALAAKFSPLTRDVGLSEARDRLAPLLKTAVDGGAMVWFDMEHYDVKDLTLQLFTELLDAPENAELNAGVVIQAYLRDSYSDLQSLLAWARGRTGRRPIAVRLVKGAYWDSETIRAGAAGWNVPVFEQKSDTDANYQRCAEALLDAHGSVRAAFASHNLVSLAQAIVAARDRSIPDGGYEIQLLHGMAEPVRDALVNLGFRVRMYCPTGELVPGMAYLVRRLLENTSNESFVRNYFAERRALSDAAGGSDRWPTAPSKQIADFGYHPEPPAEWRRGDVRARYGEAIEAQARAEALLVPGRIAGREVITADTIESVDPAEPARVVAISASCQRHHVDMAVAAARQAQPAWAAADVETRARVLEGAAQWMRDRRSELTALEVFEVAKPWADADADVCEAIDYCDYYAHEARRMAAGLALQSPPGEDNRLGYRARGVAAVIAPWNFPFAIPMGMTAAALVTGNAAILKPAEQSPGCARLLVEALEAAGAPPGVVSLLPGRGDEVGAALVESPDVAIVAFTGSREVGLALVEAAGVHRPGQRFVKRVIVEMGGKNALIVDADADLDEAVPIIVSSAFGYSGQKCSALSRLIVHADIYDDTVSRLAETVTGLRIGHPREMSVQVGPLIESSARARLQEAIAEARRVGRVIVSLAAPDDGWFVGPTVVDELPTMSRLLRDELFGPLLTVQRAESFDHALALANDTDYALTGGVVSRSPEHLGRAARELRAGNIYLNRPITGAVVGRQPFGGYGLSGGGTKAGGPDYLAWFLDPVVVSENTVRQGFAVSAPPTRRPGD